MGRLKKIAIIGPESTGKTWLAEKLSQHYKTNWVPEYARHYLNENGPEYTKEDVEGIARKQIQKEDEIAAKTRDILICDTNLIVIKVWMEFAYQSCPDWILKEIDNRHYLFHLLTKPDIAWRPDPLREHPDLREELFELYQNELEARSIPYQIIRGQDNDRLLNALKAVNNILT